MTAESKLQGGKKEKAEAKESYETFWIAMTFSIAVCISVFVSQLRLMDVVYILAIAYLLIKTGSLKIVWESGKKQEEKKNSENQKDA